MSNREKWRAKPMTPVIFKKDHDGDVCAFFPAEAGDMDPSTMACYVHIGQHSTASMFYLKDCAPAKPHEYAGLLSELHAIGYTDLVIRHRATRQDYAARKSQVQP